jgi:hypothetical protein
MSEYNYQPTVQQDDEISLKELILKLNEWIRFFISKWMIIVGVALLGGILGVLIAFIKPINYTARINFVMEEQGGAKGGLGAAAGIASQLGLNLGGAGGSGGFFQGDNIIEFMKSRSMVEKTLLTTVEIDGQPQKLVDRYVQFKSLKEKWQDSKPELASLTFVDTNSTYLQDSLMGTFYKTIIKDHLMVTKPDKKLNIIALEVVAEDELFSKYFAENLIENAKQFYIETMTQKSSANLAILTRQVDSVRRELNAAIGGVAASIESIPNANRARQTLGVPSQLRTVDVEANRGILVELVKQQELARITHRNEKPIIQTLDGPVLPLETDRIGKVKALIIGGFLGGFLMCLILLIRRLYAQIMAS